MSVNLKEDYRGRGWQNFEENLNQPRHCWYPFKEGFSNQLVSEAIRETAAKKKLLRVLDPFGGSGTTSLTSALLGHDSIAIEVNPFCVFTTKVKCTNVVWDAEEFRRLSAKIVKSSTETGVSALEGNSTFTEGNDNRKWLFNRPVLRAFEGIWSSIGERKPKYGNAMKLAAIRAAMACCNAKKDGKCLRYHPDWSERDYDAQDFRNAFASYVSRMARDVELAPISKERKVQVLRGDARDRLEAIESESCDLLVTSPPYLNSFDYSDIYRPELFLGQFVKSNEELRKIRLETVRSHVQVDWGGETSVDNAMVKVAVTALNTKSGLWNKKIPTMVEAYFHDMLRVIRHSARILRKNSEAWIVVSTSAYEGVQIPVDLILSDLACKEGFKLQGIYVLRALRAAGQQQTSFGHNGLPLRESLIRLKR